MVHLFVSSWWGPKRFFLVAPLSSTKSSFITHYFPFPWLYCIFLLTCIVFFPSHLCLFYQMVLVLACCFSPVPFLLCHLPELHLIPFPPRASALSTNPHPRRVGKVVLCFMTTAPDDRRKSWNFKLRKEETPCAILLFPKLKGYYKRSTTGFNQLLCKLCKSSCREAHLRWN